MKRTITNTILLAGLIAGSTWLYAGRTDAHRTIPLPNSNTPTTSTTQQQPIIYFFTRPDCIYCRPMHQLANRLHQEGHTVYVVGPSRHDLIRKYGVSAYPTFLVVQDDTIVRRVIGLTTKQRILGEG